MAGEFGNTTTNQCPSHLSVVEDALSRIRYGVIQLTVHDGKLMQVDITERRRFA